MRLALLLLATVLHAVEWLPGYTNGGAWVKDQLAAQVADTKAIDGKQVRVVFLGDSITCFWRQHDALWKQAFGAWTPLNLGIGADNTEHMRWRLANGAKNALEPAGLNPRVVVLMAGTNNLGGKAEKRAEDVHLLLKDVQKRWPKTVVVLMSITPRGKGPEDPAYADLQATNPLIRKFADGKKVVWCDLNAQMTWDGTKAKGISRDLVHFTDEGYQMWADLLTPMLKVLLK